MKRPDFVRAVTACVAATGLSVGTALAQEPGEGVRTADTATAGTNRLFFAPTGRTLPGGVGEFGTYQLFLPYVGYAFHDRVMVSAGTPILSEALGRYWYVAPKLGLVRSRLWNVAAGGLLILEAGDPFTAEDTDIPRSFFWGVLTYGTPAAGVTVGVASELGRFEHISESPVILTGGELEFIRPADPSRVALRILAESYWATSPDAGSTFRESIHAIGIRLRAKRAAFEVVELVFVDPHNVESSPFPFFNISVLF